MPGLPAAPPVLSTPDTHIFEDPTAILRHSVCRKTNEEINLTYEIPRTIAEIRRGAWRRVALQFPDEMLPDAPRVFEALRDGLRKSASNFPPVADRRTSDQLVDEISALQLANGKLAEERLYILADTSYGACCVDEVAAEHVDADVVVHYGRSCLSPTARLPVIYVFTRQDLPLEPVVKAFVETYPDRKQKIILTADVTYASHLPQLSELLALEGYQSLFTTSTVHDPSSPLPNRTLPEETREETSKLKEWQLFHISDPPQSLLLTLSSRVLSIHSYPTSQADILISHKPLLTSTALALRRRYALLTSLSTVPIFGILINTLSVKNYLHIVEHVKAQIRAAGKKSYTFVVGKVNAAKIANFGEIGGWVVIGCWESSLVESKDFWKPVITPFELKLALKGDGERVWTGEWSSSFQAILDEDARRNGLSDVKSELDGHKEFDEDEIDSESESEPPEFDLRTGRYISHSRPMRSHEATEQAANLGGSRAEKPSNSLVKRPKGDLAIVRGELSPGAEFLQSKRTWRGLGSDLDIAYDENGVEAVTKIEEGRSGIARGYRYRDGEVS